MARTFLTARWEDLVLVTYEVSDALLEPHLPPGLELDRSEGRACASLVGFRFLDTRVFGVRWPMHRDFPEFNLRFYVREGDRRGVVFVREFVPRRLIAMTARRLYNEPYVYTGMSEEVGEIGDERRAAYGLRSGGVEHRVEVGSDRETFTPSPGSTEHFFKEHQWGYGRTRRGAVLRYEVAHPTWAVHRVREHRVDVDWGALYGSRWDSMNGETPISVVHAVGSGVSVHAAERVGSG